MTFDAASKPILFLLDREFEDGQIPGQRFFCRHSLLLEGALSSIDGLDAQLDVRRIGFARPRREVIAEIGEQDQSLPKLVLPQGVRSELASGAHQDRQYISGAEPILAALNGLLGIPVAHPLSEDVTMSYQISVLDKSPVAEGASPEQALRNSLQLAQRAEQLGYHRYWFAEHHAAPTLASPAPEVLAAWVLAQTRRIRIGSGGVMLRHYAPYKVAENFNLLSALAPGRVDLGVGKAPGGLPASTAALAAGRPAFADFDQQLRDLEGYLSGADTEAQARPVPQQAPERFLLGASPQSAQQAAELGWRFVYAAHFDGDPKHIEAAFDAYRTVSTQPPLLATVAFAAPTAEAAARHIGALRVYKLHLGPGQTVNLPSPDAAAEYARQVGVADFRIEETRPSVLSGDAQHVRDELDALHRRFGVGEFVLDAPVADLDARLTSLELLSPAPRAAVA